MMLLLVLPTLSSSGQSRTFRLSNDLTEKDYDPHTIVVKLKKTSQKGNTGLPGIEELSALIKGKKFKKAVPRFQRYHHKSLHKQTDLSEIYKITIQDKENLEAKINQLLTHENVIYAEPYYLPKPLFIPNDPSASLGGDQTYLSIIDAYNAWEFEKGDSSLIIGVLDTGIDLDHEDLVDNIYYNDNDPINGIDDDNDGYIDNYHGWDFADNDNDPSADFSGHGTSVAGVSSARTDNGIGIAGVGFKSKFLPIKIFDSENNVFNNGYEAILYAAEQGCQIINLSWGSPGTFSHFAQDVINFVVLDMDVVVVAAAGNTNADLHFYPASYEHVLSVGASNGSDQKANFATYSHFIDLTAPGSSEYTTKNENGYGNSTGSSFSSPMVAGVAALVRSRYPGLNARQVMEKIRITTDDIYQVAGNETYFEQLGRGRLNAQSAVAPTSQPAIRMSNLNHNNNVGPYAIAGDTVNITMDFINILNTTANTQATLTCSSPFVTIINDSFNIGSLVAMEKTSNANAPYIIYLDPATPANTKLIFRLGYEDVNYSDYQYFELLVGTDYINLDNGKILLTISDDGNLAYTDSQLTTGRGLMFETKKILDHIGVAFGVQPDKVVDNIIYDLNSGQKNSDFDNQASFQFFDNSIAPIDVHSTFTDGAAAAPINLQITQNFLSSNLDTANNFLIIEYRITNLSGGDLPELHAGMYADWDIGEYTTNTATWDLTHRLGYIHDPGENNQYAGIALISNQQPIYNAINLGSENGNTQDYTGTFTKSNKYDLLTGSIKEMAGEIGAGNDVAHFLSGKELNLKHHHSTKVTFVIAVANSLSLLQETVTKASDFYTDYIQNPPVSEIFNICEEESLDVNPSSGTNYRFYADVDTTQLLGQGEFYTTGPLTENKSFFVINTDAGFDGDVEQIKVVIKDPAADFLSSRDTVFIDENNHNSVQFTDLSNESISWDWDFGNGFFSTAQNPIINFEDEGDYEVKMKVTTATGCLDSITHQIVAVTRSPKPVISNFLICPGEPVLLQAANTNAIGLYTNENLTPLVSQGSTITIENLQADTSFYVTNKEGLYESLPVKVAVEVSEINAAFNYAIDSVVLNQKIDLIFNGLSDDAITWDWYVDQNPAGNLRNFSLQPSEEKNVTVALVTRNQEGCSDSTGQVISFKVSPQPPARNFRFCKGEEIAINLPKVSFYNFYESEDLSQLIGKGSYLNLGALETSKVIYYTNLDSLLESEPNLLEMEVIDNFADFSLDGETVFLNHNDELAFSDLSPFSVSRQWYLDDQLISSDSSFLQNFEFSGNYLIRLITENDLGCVDSLEKSLKVLLVTGLNSSLPEKDITIYPNPSHDVVFINTQDLNENLYTLQLFSESGKIVMDKTYRLSAIKKGINLAHLAPGAYYLKLYGKNVHHSAKKLILE
ncbi:S8 family serine peptidase [Fulvivirgaceae bacterium BMA12]|uniref:S8 family serine peptidase n=1 Tax=Agaribacillus aureus TaxID=3051825 RepID=A0ABT8L1F2_9BACT|nr:S8 family serine peptidase [Fulvivirgaceae bacterium BMA12]